MCAPNNFHILAPILLISEPQQNPHLCPKIFIPVPPISAPPQSVIASYGPDYLGLDINIRRWNVELMWSVDYHGKIILAMGPLLNTMAI